MDTTMMSAPTFFGRFTTVLFRLLCVAVIFFWAPLPAALAWDEVPGCQEDILGDPPEEQLILTCVPPEGSPVEWNNVLIVYAHGFVSAVPPDKPLELPDLDFNGLSIHQVLMQLGFAFATSSFHKNGYAVEQAGNDLNILVDHFKTNVAPDEVSKVLIIGNSEGGLITTMLVEGDPDTYDGGLAMCGLVGGTNYEIQYVGDFRAVFDYFFPWIFEFGVVNVPEKAYLDLEKYTLDISQAFLDYPERKEQLFRVTKVARDPANPASDLEATLNLVAYNIGGINDLKETAGGNPYGNLARWYWGSNNDWTLNFGVERIRADRVARQYLRQYYQPTGKLQVPLITLHTILDEIVPFNHEVIYALRVFFAGSGNLLTILPVQRYGHCNFEPKEILGALGLLLKQTGTPLSPAMEAYTSSISELLPTK